MFKLLSLLGITVIAEAMEVQVNRLKKTKGIDLSWDENYSKTIGEYRATIYLGESKQKIDDICLDTGSYMPWIKVSNWCTQAKCPGVTPAYDIKKSTTFM